MRKCFFLILLLIVFQLCAVEHTGLALSGGGARGLAHIGVLKVLDEENIQIDYISGTSIGALIASLYACGYSANEIEEMVLELDFLNQIDSDISRENKHISFKHWKAEDSFSFRLYNNYIPMLPESITSGNNIINELAMMTWECGNVKNFDELTIPLRITATDIITGEPEVFSEGCLHEAIFASFCFPTILKPFKLNDSYYIDGGIRSNLPLEPLLATDADFLIGIKVNSPLKKPEEINNVVDILEQTAGIAIKSNVKKSIEFCDLLIMPEIDNYSMLEFSKAKEIIDAGEAAARNVLPQLRNLPKRTTAPNLVVKNDIYIFDEIKIEGNLYLQKSEIFHYLGLEKKQKYSKQAIKSAFNEAYNSDLFQLIYPVMQINDNKRILIVKVKEKMRSKLLINPIYNSDAGISLQSMVSFKNLLLNDSNMLISLKVSQSTQFCVDYLKNIGNDYGLYFHLFPYLKEVPLYSYDEDNIKTNSVKALETGETSGIGFFFRKILSFELYNFAYHKKLYRDIGIADVSKKAFRSQGIGVKLYFETLDDLVFAKKGIQLISKYYIASSSDNIEKDYQRSLHKFQLVHPLTDNLSLRYYFEYGSYFEEMVPYDPFYIGGIDSFPGLHKYDRSASIYKINGFSFRLNPFRNLFIETLVTNLKLGDSDNWEIDNDLLWSGGLILGYKTPLGPIRAGLAIMEHSNLAGYLSIGYDLDVFEFSKR